MPNYGPTDEDCKLRSYHALCTMGLDHETAKALVHIPGLRYYTDKLGSIVEAIQVGALVCEIAEACYKFMHQPRHMDTYLDRRRNRIAHGKAIKHTAPRRVRLSL